MSAHETVVLPLQVSRIARSTSAAACSSWWLVACGCGWRWGLIAPWAMETSSPRLEHQSAAFRQRNVRCNVCDATDEVLLASALRVGTPMLVHLPRVSRVLSRSVRAARPHSVANLFSSENDSVHHHEARNECARNECGMIMDNH